MSEIMNIITCFKLVPEEQDIVVNSDLSLSLDKAEVKISLYDLNAVEAACQLINGGEGQVIALSAGGKALDNSKARKDILSRGPDALYLVKDDQLANSQPYETAKALAAAAAKIGFDLIICGEGSGDLYAQQVGLLTGEMLGLPTLNAVSHISLNGDMIRVERTLENEVEIIDVSLPVLLCVTSDINTPKIPSMKAILGAGKKTVTQWSGADINWSASDCLVESVAVIAPQQTERKRLIIEGDSEDMVNTLAEHLRKAMN